MENKKRILVVNNGSGECKVGLVEPHLKLNEIYPDLVEIDIESELDPTDFHYFESYDYVVYHRCIGNTYEKCKELIQYLKNTNTKTVLYVDEFWQLPKEHPYYKQFNERKFHQKISNNMRLVDMIYCYNNKKLFDNIISLNPNSFLFNFSPSLKYIPSIPFKDLIKIGIKPNLYDIENIKLLTDIHKYFTNYNKIQFVLIGFDPRETAKQYNHFTGEITEVVKKLQDTIWVAYERIITNDYKICSKEYKDFLLKYLPNNKYNGDIDKEPYKRIWYNEIKDGNYECHCLLKPQVTNKYNELKYDIDIAEYFNYGFEVVSTFPPNTFSPNKTSVPKQWADCIKKVVEHILNKETIVSKEVAFHNIDAESKLTTILSGEIYNIELMYNI
jgi:hypothetical protein